MRLSARREGALLGGGTLLLVAAALLLGYGLNPQLVSPWVIAGAAVLGGIGGVLLAYREVAETSLVRRELRIVTWIGPWARIRCYSLDEFDSVRCTLDDAALGWHRVQLQGPRIGVLLPPLTDRPAEAEAIARQVALELGLRYDQDGRHRPGLSGLGWSDADHRRRR